MTRAAELGLLALFALAGCRPEPGEPPSEPAPTLEPPLAVEHGPLMPYAGTWVGPKLRLEFAGRWVLVEPAEPAPGQAPLELRVVVERREGEYAFALLTSIAGAMPVDFLRPGDWTMLVEDGALALAMGDEPLERYERVDAAPTLIGPALVDPAELPEQVVFEHGIACLEFAGSQCASFEGEGPRAVGCREAVWAACVEHPDAAVGDLVDGGRVDEIAGAPMLLAAMLAALRWSAGLEAAATGEQLEPARALRARVLAGATTLVDALAERGVLLDGDPKVDAIRAHLRAAARD